MVHALKEAWRVLIPQGIMVDLRPLPIDVPLEVVYHGGREAAGTVDMSLDWEFDVAPDKAIDQVLREGIFAQNLLEMFDYTFYWRTFHGMVIDLEENWKGDLEVPEEVLKTAREIYLAHRPKARLRLPMKMKLGVYKKTFEGSNV